MDKFMHSFSNDFADEIYGKQQKNEGIIIHQFEDEGVKSSWIVIEDKDNVYKKDIGNYVTIELDKIEDNEDGYRYITMHLKRLLKIQGIKKDDKILVVGLGNDRYLSDALGPKVIERINVTSHILAKKKIKELRYVSCLVPGVMASTGMESSQIIKSIVDKFQIDVVIVVDSLATRSVKRLYKTFQLSDTGIAPGSGVNNYRKEISKKTLGIPVVALGVATVVDSAAIVANTIALLDKNLSSKMSYAIIEKVLVQQEHNLVMTSKEIDRIIYRIADVASRAINYALNPILCK